MHSFQPSFLIVHTPDLTGFVVTQVNHIPRVGSGTPQGRYRENLSGLNITCGFCG